MLGVKFYPTPQWPSADKGPLNNNKNSIQKNMKHVLSDAAFHLPIDAKNCREIIWTLIRPKNKSDPRCLKNFQKKDLCEEKKHKEVLSKMHFKNALQ